MPGSPPLGGARWQGDEIGRMGPYQGSKRPGCGVWRNRFWLYCDKGQAEDERINDFLGVAGEKDGPLAAIGAEPIGRGPQSQNVAAVLAGMGERGDGHAAFVQQRQGGAFGQGAGGRKQRLRQTSCGHG